ncbi:MAG: hypothetical protein QOD86_1468 [Miltoncostaeaceae bacterium]|jgi:protein SCO1/2|nr:hypothetical protein [Miltoncostaeaceae bacterium]
MRRLAALLLLVLAGLLLVAGCGSDDPEADAGTASQSTAPFPYQGFPIDPRQPAPPLRLQDVDGGTVDLKDMVGKPTLVSFVYSQCPDTCPLTLAALNTVRRNLGPKADDFSIVLVSTDPTGDTPKNVRDFLEKFHLRGHAKYLVGTEAQLRPVWRAWQIEREVDEHVHAEDMAGHHDGHAGLIGHDSFTFGIDASGRLTTAYPVDGQVDLLLHDLPLLETSV